MKSNLIFAYLIFILIVILVLGFKTYFNAVKSDEDYENKHYDTHSLS
jgi:hypothetical protein